MLVTAYLLPWITGTIWLVWLDTFALWDRLLDSSQSAKINWPRVLGYGFFLGNFIGATANHAVYVNLEQLSVTPVAGIMIGLSLLGLFLIRHRYRQRRFALVSRFCLPDGNNKWLIILLSMLILLHLVLASLDVLSRLLLPWDAWTTWTYRAKIWFLNQQLSPLVDRETWLAATGSGIYTINAYAYPMVVSLIQLWPVQVYGYWNDSLAILPGLLAGLAIALAMYGQGRSLAWSGSSMLVAVYLLLSVPLLDAHLALPGYADLWLAGFAGLGFVALLQWTQSRDKSQLILGSMFIILGLWIKQEGMIWMLTGMLFIMPYLLPWQWLLTIAVGLFLLIVSGHSLLDMPLLGQIGYADGTLYLAHLGTLPLQLQDISSAVARNLFFHASWNQIYFWLSAALLLAMLPARSRSRRTLLWFLLLISAVIAGLFFLSTAGHWAQDNTAFNRVILQMLPAFVFSLLLSWRSLFHSEISQSAGEDRA